jgi:hypothetical protein
MGLVDAHAADWIEHHVVALVLIGGLQAEIRFHELDNLPFNPVSCRPVVHTVQGHAELILALEPEENGEDFEAVKQQQGFTLAVPAYGQPQFDVSGKSIGVVKSADAVVPACGVALELGVVKALGQLLESRPQDRLHQAVGGGHELTMSILEISHELLKVILLQSPAFLRGGELSLDPLLEFVQVAHGTPSHWVLPFK